MHWMQQDDEAIRITGLNENFVWDDGIEEIHWGPSNRPFAAFHALGTKPPCWNAKVSLGQDQQKAYIILNGNFLCLSCPSATFLSQHGGFVPRKWKAAKGLFRIN